ncbi:hypothetical protein [Hydrogenophaga sp. MI9]|uniref:hypothetical protein n=1 Tax=Hydrogenophaga sp. MI9 TaxID=3453719 RepID=UPI003EF00FB2
MFWADFAEIKALVHPDRCFTSGDLSGVAQRAKDMGRGFEPAARWRDILNYVQIRGAAFGTAYPFEVSDDQDTIAVAFDGSQRQRLYLALLLASSLRTLEKGRRNGVARIFEEISFAVFSKLLPPGSEIRATWAGPGRPAPYEGTLFQKLTALAADLRCTPNFAQADFNLADTGDGGMDIVAWHPMSDLRSGIPIAMAQCGCSRDDWEHKQLEAHPVKHSHRLPVMHPWANYYFMPLDFRRADGDWAKKSDLAEVIIVDRLRILGLAEQFAVLDEMPAFAYVDEARAAAIT